MLQMKQKPFEILASFFGCIFLLVNICVMYAKGFAKYLIFGTCFLPLSKLFSFKLPICQVLEAFASWLRLRHG